MAKCHHSDSMVTAYGCIVASIASVYTLEKDGSSCRLRSAGTAFLDVPGTRPGDKGTPGLFLVRKWEWFAPLPKQRGENMALAQRCKCWPLCKSLFSSLATTVSERIDVCLQDEGIRDNDRKPTLFLLCLRIIHEFLVLCNFVVGHELENL